MRDLAERMEQTRKLVDERWTDERAEVVERGLGKRRRARTRRRAFGAVMALAIFGLAFGFVRRASLAPTQVASSVVAEPSASPVHASRLDDGSTVTQLESTTLVQWREVSASRVTIGLERGSVRCDVHPNPARVFRVQAGDLTVEVLGTAFRVERFASDQARIIVERGRVRVSVGSVTGELGVGESASFPTVAPREAPVEPARSVASPSAPPSASPSASPRTPVAASTWRRLAEEGAFDEAYDALHREGKNAVKDEVNDLLLVADVARHSRHSGEAVEPLRKILTAHRADPRASLAAFTLGRILLDELGRPGEAAAAFADVRVLQPDGALVQDALAREVEARSRAGDAPAARALAEKYVREYPSGARLRLVRRHGGLE